LKINFLSVLVLSLIIIGCGGGNGGGSANSGIRIIHGSLQTPPLQAKISYGEDTKESLNLTNSGFGDTSADFKPLDSTTATLSLTTIGGLREVARVNLELQESNKATVLLYGSLASTKVIEEIPIKDLNDTNVAIRLINLVSSTSEITAEFPDITESITVGNEVVSPYVLVNPGNESIRIKSAGSSVVLATSSFNLLSGNAYSIVAMGEAGVFVGIRIFVDNDSSL
jgi:hypothetical protein